MQKTSSTLQLYLWSRTKGMIYDLTETLVILHGRIKFLFEASIFRYKLQAFIEYGANTVGDTALSSILPGIKRNETRDWGIRGVHTSMRVHISYLYSNYILS